MPENYLITGYHGVPHVTAENDRGINAAIFGKGRFVLPVGEQFRAEYIGNNTIRMYDGKLMDNGAAAGIPAGRYIDLLIPESGQGKYRSDIIAFCYKKDPSTLVESGSFVVIQGVEETEYPANDPVFPMDDLLTDNATEDYMELWRVEVSATVISAPQRLFHVSRNLQTVVPVADALSDDGFTYTASVDGVNEMYNGLTITIIPRMSSSSKYPLLNVNGLGAETIKRRISGQMALTAALPDDEWLRADKPVTVTFNGEYWLMDNTQPSANDLYGSVPIEKGGTGASTLEKAQKNLHIHPGIESTDYPGCYYRMVDGEQEWLNPPMVVGEEYRTAERFIGAPVYTAMVKGTVPASGQTAKVRFSIGVTGLLRLTAVLDNAATVPVFMPMDATAEISTYILRLIIDNSNGAYTPGKEVVAQAWFIKADTSELGLRQSDGN